MENGRDIIPSHMSLTRTPRYDDGGVFDEWRLRYGEVQEIIYPDDDRNRSQKFTEYNVLVQYRDGGAGTGVIFTNCLLSNGLAGLADSCSYTLRAPETPSIKDTDKYGLGLGSKVLIACLNGERSNAYIVGGQRDPQDKGDDKNDGHHYFWTFNGIQAQVNDDGECTITYTGKSKIDGTLDDSVTDSAPGAMAQFLKNGNINIQTKDGKQQILLDNENGKLVFQRDMAFEIGQATDKMLLGTTYRNSQQQLHQQLQNQLQEMQQQFTLMATLFASAVGNLGAPIPALVGAAPAMVQCSVIASQMATAIAQFEGNADSYLSQKNSLD